MQAKDLDKKFDDGDTVLDCFDLDTLRKPLKAHKQLNIDSPTWPIQLLDEESRHPKN